MTSSESPADDTRTANDQGRSAPDLLAQEPEVNIEKEYRLCHPGGEVDLFVDIGDAVDFRDDHFPDGVLFQRTVTTVVAFTEWAEVSS